MKTIKQNIDKRNFALKCFLFVFILIYLGIFLYLNLMKYAQHVDSDIAAEALLAREIWTEKDLTPDNWISSTERRVVGMPTVMALFYGVFHSMTMAAGISCVMVSAIFIIVFFWFLKRIGMSDIAVMTSILALLALPINGLRNDGQIVPFVTLLLFLFADYYVIHSILMFFSIMFYIHLKNGNFKHGKPGLMEIIAWGFLFLFTIALCLGGQRCLQVLILPIIAAEAVFLFIESDSFKNRIPKKRYYATGFVGTLALAFLISNVYRGQKNYEMFLLSPEQIAERVFVTIPAAILEGFGIAGNTSVGSFGSVMQMLVWAFLVLVGYGICLVVRRKTEMVTKEQKEAISILTASLGITGFIVAVTTVEAAQNYFFVAWFIAALILGIMIDYFRRKKSLFANLILFAICCFSVLNIKYTYVDALTVTDNLKEYEEVADYLIQEDISYGYAEFWDASRISLVRDGAVTMGSSYGMENLEMYWWLTSTDWYPPNLPEEMKTAYVVRIPKKDAFEAQFQEEGIVELRFENDIFAVYISDMNFVNIQ